jgi:quercetin dioxygenase-like cupin family protein
MLHPTTAKEELIGHNVSKCEPNDGPRLRIGDWFLTWKAQGLDTGYSFSVYETTLAPGHGLPLHKHPFAEFFYVLEGNVDFCRWNDEGVSEWLTCAAGGSILAPVNAPHTFLNKSSQPARILSVSTYHHERMLKDAVNPGGNMNYLPAQLTQEGFERLFKSMEANQVYVVADHV